MPRHNSYLYQRLQHAAVRGGGLFAIAKSFQTHPSAAGLCIKWKRQGQEWGESNFPLMFLSVCGAGCVFHGVLALCKSALIRCKRAEVFKFAIYFTFSLLYLALKTCSCNSNDSPHQTTPVHLQSTCLQTQKTLLDCFKGKSFIRHWRDTNFSACWCSVSCCVPNLICSQSQQLPA